MRRRTPSKWSRFEVGNAAEEVVFTGNAVCVWWNRSLLIFPAWGRSSFYMKFQPGRSSANRSSAPDSTVVQDCSSRNIDKPSIIRKIPTIDIDQAPGVSILLLREKLFQVTDTFPHHECCSSLTCLYCTAQFLSSWVIESSLPTSTTAMTVHSFLFGFRPCWHCSCPCKERMAPNRDGDSARNLLRQFAKMFLCGIGSHSFKLRRYAENKIMCL